MTRKLSRQIVATLVAIVLIVVGRHAYLGQFEWISGASEDEILEVIEMTSSVAGFKALEQFSLDEANWIRDEIRQDLRRQRKGVTSSITARNLMVEVRRRHGSLLLTAPDDLNKQVIFYQSRWLAAVENDAEMCDRILSLGDAGVLHARLDEFADKELRDNSIIFDAMRASTQNRTEREMPTNDEWLRLYQHLLESGFSAADFALLEPENIRLPESCAAMRRYMNAVVGAEIPNAEKMRAAIAKSLMEL